MMSWWIHALFCFGRSIPFLWHFMALIQQLLIEKLVHPTQNICLFSLMYEGMDGEKRP